MLSKRVEKSQGVMRPVGTPCEIVVMATTTEDTTLIGRALAYMIELYRELTDENDAPTLGTQNQSVYFILTDLELREAVPQ
jgi:hypothetical protein